MHKKVTTAAEKETDVVLILLSYSASYVNISCKYYTKIQIRYK